MVMFKRVKALNFLLLTFNSLFITCLSANPSPLRNSTAAKTTHCDKGLHLKDLNCSHYSSAHRRYLDNGRSGLGTRMSFDIPDHSPDLCKECEKPNGSCGVGLRCICHPHECKDKVISAAGATNMKYFSNLLLVFAISSSFILLLPSFLSR